MRPIPESSKPFLVAGLGHWLSHADGAVRGGEIVMAWPNGSSSVMPVATAVEAALLDAWFTGDSRQYWLRVIAITHDVGTAEAPDCLSSNRKMLFQLEPSCV